MTSTSSIDNAVSGIDIFGSWAEIGMVLVAVAAGVLIALPGLKAIQKKKEKRSLPRTRTGLPWMTQRGAPGRSSMTR